MVKALDLAELGRTFHQWNHHCPKVIIKKDHKKTNVQIVGKVSTSAFAYAHLVVVIHRLAIHAQDFSFNNRTSWNRRRTSWRGGKFKFKWKRQIK